MQISGDNLIGGLAGILISIISTSAAWWKLYTEKRQLKNMTLQDLRSTKLFERIDVLINEYATFMTGCRLRRELFRDIMCIKLTVFKEEVHKLIMREDVGQLTDSEFITRLRNFLSDVLTRGYTECLDNNIPEFILEKLTVKTEAFMAITNAAITRVCEDDITYSNKYVKTCTLLWEITDRVGSEVPIITRTLSDFNGEISSIEYKGFSKEDCTDSRCSCKKSNLRVAIIHNATILRAGRECAGKNIGCVWKQFPENLNLVSDIDLVNATFRCTQCLNGIKKPVIHDTTEFSIEEIEKYKCSKDCK